jgi:formate dehydrogenase major subunit
MSFATNGNGNGKGAPLRPEDYTPIWPMVPGTRKITVTINGQEVQAEEGHTILQATRVLGIDVPTLCWYPKLAPYGACRICVVEVEGQDNTPISCGTQIEEGMVITTHSDRLVENRRMVRELIFSDHDAYCLPPCQFKCPTRVDIPGYLKQNTLGNWEEATRILKRSLPFPAILGRVCPAPCETHCRREEVDTAIAIRDSHRYCADRVLEVDAPAPTPGPRSRPGRRVRSSARPGGMAAAYYLQPRPPLRRLRGRSGAGRMLRLRDPAYGLEGVDGPRAEPRLGAGRHLRRTCASGATSTSPTSWSRTTTRSTSDRLLQVERDGDPGRGCQGVVNALENLPTAPRHRDPGAQDARVVVIGGGFTAIDCTRTSLRQGPPR